jgi:hypothetical protein
MYLNTKPGWNMMGWWAGVSYIGIFKMLIWHLILAEIYVFVGKL